MEPARAPQTRLVGEMRCTHAELAASPSALALQQSANDLQRRISLLPGTEVLPGWTLTVDVTENGYWFIIRDRLDACGFAYVGNQDGRILKAETIR